MTCFLLHGLGQTPSSWDRVTDGLPGAADVRRPGLFDTPERPLTYEKLYRALEAECASAGRPLHICGVSLGAVLALNYAVENPSVVGSLVLAAPQYRTPRLLSAVQSAAFHIIPQKAFDGMGLSKADVIALVSSMKGLNLTSGLRRIECPAFIVCGARDRANARAAVRLARAVPGSKLHFIEGAGHEVNIDAPSELASIIREAWR